MRRLRVWHVVESLAPRDVSRLATAIAAGLPPAAFDVQLVCRRTGSLSATITPSSVTTHEIGNGRLGRPSAARDVCRRVRAAAPDVVHLWDDWARRFVGPGLAWSQSSRIVCSVRTLPRTTSWGRRCIERYVLRHVAAVVANHPQIAAENRANYGLETTEPWHIAIDGLLPPCGTAVDRESAFASIQIPTDVRLLATAVDADSFRDAKDVIWATKLLCEMRDDVRLLVLVDGDGTELLQRFAASLGVDAETRFTSDPADLQRCLPHLAVYLDAACRANPSGWITAAQATGVPVVAVDSPIRRDEIEADRTGYLVGPHDRAALGSRCLRLFRDDALRTAFATAARERAAQSTSITDMVERYADVYRRAAAALK